MLILTNAPLKSEPVIQGTEDYCIDFPTIGVTHILEMCCRAPNDEIWPEGAYIAVGFQAFDSHDISGITGDYDRAVFQTFIPMYDFASSPMRVKKNCGIPIAPPRTGRVILKAVNMPPCYVSVHPNQETRPQASVYLPCL